MGETPIFLIMTKYKKYFNEVAAELPFRVFDNSGLFWGVHNGKVTVDLITINSCNSLTGLCELFHELGHVKHFQSLNKRNLKRAERIFHYKKGGKYKKRDLEFVQNCELAAWDRGWKLANQFGIGKDKRFKKAFKKQAIKDMKSYGMKVTIADGE